ncbi:MAG: 16S rRNA (guanine(527)-N(7))-methyltransferase RsmG [Myxococcota bacterium]
MPPGGAQRSTGNILGFAASSDSPRVRDLLDRGLAELGLAVGASEREALVGLANLLETWSERMNLTGHRSAEAIVHRLVLDAAALATCLPDVDRLADVGSGAGFPGLPLAILRPHCRVTLIEARRKRHHFQRAAVRELGLVNAEPLHGRAEELSPRPHAAAVAQALAPPARAIPWLLPWVADGGLVLLLRSATPADVPEIPGVRAEGFDRYRVPLGGPERTLWWGRRCAT